MLAVFVKSKITTPPTAVGAVTGLSIVPRNVSPQAVPLFVATFVASLPAPESSSQVIVPPVFHFGTCPLLGVSLANVATA
jgi:hypothetical protein